MSLPSIPQLWNLLKLHIPKDTLKSKELNLVSEKLEGLSGKDVF